MLETAGRGRELDAPRPPRSRAPAAPRRLRPRSRTRRARPAGRRTDGAGPDGGRRRRMLAACSTGDADAPGAGALRRGRHAAGIHVSPRDEEHRIVDDLFELREDVARDQHGAPLGGEAAQSVRRSMRACGSRPDAGSSSSSTCGSCTSAARQPEPLLLPAREHLARGVRQVLQAHLREQVDGPRRCGGRRHPVQPGRDHERLAGGERAPRAERVGHPPEDRAGSPAGRPSGRCRRR